MALCMNPDRARHNVPDGGRKVMISVFWGADDLRDDWQGDYVMCSFQCLSEWAAARAKQHDGHVLVEGT